MSNTRIHFPSSLSVSNTWHSSLSPSVSSTWCSLSFVPGCIQQVLVSRHCVCSTRGSSRHCSLWVFNTWYCLSLSLPVSSTWYSLFFVTNCIQLVLAWHTRPHVLFSYRTCSCFSAATLQPYATQTSLISVSVRSFPSPSTVTSSFSVSSPYLSLTCSGLTGIWLFGLVWDCGLFWFVFEEVTYVLVLNVSPWYAQHGWRGVKTSH